MAQELGATTYEEVLELLYELALRHRDTFYGLGICTFDAGAYIEVDFDGERQHKICSKNRSHMHNWLSRLAGDNLAKVDEHGLYTVKHESIIKHFSAIHTATKARTRAIVITAAKWIGSYSAGIISGLIISHYTQTPVIVNIPTPVVSQATPAAPATIASTTQPH
jgi:hypothetical protein